MSLVLAIDFDGTITEEAYCAKFPTIRSGCVETLKEFKNAGFKLILWTCRTGDSLESAKFILQHEGILDLFDAINEQLPEIREKYEPIVAKKVWADYYIDDKNLETDIDWSKIKKLVFEKYSKIVKDKKQTELELDETNKQLRQVNLPIEDKPVKQKKIPTVNEYFKTTLSKKIMELLPNLDLNELQYLVDYYTALPFVDKTKPIREDNLLFCITFPYLAKIQYKKEATYGSSWCKRGEMDVFFNLARKFDRLENMMLKGAKDEVGEDKIDTVADLTNYGLLWMTYLLRNNSKAFQDWTNKN